MKKIVVILSAVVALAMTSVSLADCANGQFGIEYFNNKFQDGVTVVVQSDAGQELVRVKGVDNSYGNGTGAQLCFQQDFESYKLIEFTSSGNYVYDISKQTLIDHGYFMNNVYATDSNFHQE